MNCYEQIGDSRILMCLNYNTQEGLHFLHCPLFSTQVAATYVLVLTPTRELAVQVHSMVTTLAQHTDISAALVVGGLSSQVCVRRLHSIALQNYGY